MKTLEKLARRHPDQIESVEHDEDGYWVYLKDGWVSALGTYILHEDTVKDILAEFAMIQPETTNGKLGISQ